MMGSRMVTEMDEALESVISYLGISNIAQRWTFDTVLPTAWKASS